MQKKRNYESSSRRGTSLIPRRDFFRYLGGGMIIFFNPVKINTGTAGTQQQARSVPKDYNAFLHIAGDGTITCLTGKIEMGQGPITALAQMMADEMDVPFEKVKMVMGDTDLCPWDDGTWGSTSIREYGPAMRLAAAEARTILIQMASEKLKVPVSRLEVRDGIIIDSGNTRNRIGYGELTAGKKIEKYLSGKPVLKDPSKFRYIGKPFKRQDALLKVTGEAKYTADIRLPGMMHARIVRPPVYGARLISADTSEAEKIGGIQVVRDKELVALLHENRDKVDEAIVKVKAEYGPVNMTVNNKTVYDHYLKTATAGVVVNKKGDISTGRLSSSVIIESEFHHAYVAHAPVEPHAALASKEGNRITVWVSAQTPFLVQDTVASALGIPLENVHVIVPFVGGGFGGKGDNPQAVEAAILAWKTGKPVLVAWTREEEFFYDTLRPAAVVRLSSGMDNQGKLTFWDFSTYCAGDRGSETIYEAPHQHTVSYDQAENGPQVHPFATGPWRAPGQSNNTFAREMQMCLMASKAGIDPLDFRLKNLKDEKMTEVLKAAADKFGYKPSKGPSGRGIGIACGIDVDTWVALIGEVRVDKTTGKVQLVRVVCAQNMGMCVNPQGTILQIEGCVTMGLGYSFTEELMFEGADMLSRNFDTYELPRFSWVPKIESVVLNKLSEPPHGGGEPAIIGVGGMIASGIFDATGAILYDMPMTPARVLDALKKV